MQPVVHPRRASKLVLACRRWGLLKRPPTVGGVEVEPIIFEGSKVPNIRYVNSFWVLRAHTTPRQVNVEFTILLVEMAALWGGIWLLSTWTGIASINPLAPILTQSGLANPFNGGSRTLGQQSSLHLTYLALAANVAAVVSVLLFWVYGWMRKLLLHQSCPDSSLWLRNFLYVWVTNVTGFAELVLVYPVLGYPSVNNYLGINFWLLLAAYGLFLATLSTFTVSVMALRVLEDLFLLALALF